MVNLIRNHNYNTKNLFGITMFFNYILYFFIFDYNGDHVEISIILRMIASILCVPIIFIDFLNNRNTNYKKLYWYFVVTYCLPFFFTFMTLLNGLSSTWLMNSVSAAFLAMLILKMRMFFTVISAGISLAVIIYSQIFGYNIDVDYGTINLLDIVATYFAVIIIGSIFLYNRETIDEERNRLTNNINTLNESLEQKVQELERALAAKTEFLNNVSHEVRTPVQGFVNMSQAAYEDWGSFSDKEKHELLEKVFISASRLGSMVCSLLDLAKFTQGKMIMFPSDCELKKIIKEIIEECKFLYLTDKKIDIIFDFDGSIQLHVDKERITQLLRNLLFNAIKFSDSDTKIEIKLLPSDLTYEDGSVKKSVHCIVTDQGKGVPENELEAIFEPFTQSTRTNTKAGGTGLGLAIAREIATSHHGKIWAENNKDVGSSFHFIIPLTLNKGGGEKTTSSYQGEKPEGSGYILLVDDESYILNMLERMLAFGNYKTLKAQKAKEGLALLKEHQNQIILVMLDYMMPGMDGLGFLKRKNADEELKKIPVIFQSGTNEEKVLNEAWEMGIASFLPKPYNREKVLEEVGKVLKR